MTKVLCPRCRGEKHVAKPPWVPADQHTWVTTGTQTYLCGLCGGAGVIQE